MRLIWVFFILLCTCAFVNAQTPQHSVIEENQAYREKLDKEYASDKGPLKPGDRASFKGLPFYPIDTSFRVLAKFERAGKVKPFKMKTTTSSRPVYELYGKLYFEMGGKKCTLNVYQSHRLRAMVLYKDHLFLAFTDQTSGNETYGGGRFLDLTIPKTDEVVLDFNKAYNPYCAYNSRYSCPIPPKENFLDLKITAGVKYSGH